MRYFPDEVELDLLDKNCDIRDWWCRTRRADGKLLLTSRRVMLILQGSDEEGAFKTAYRDDWSSKQYSTASLINEVRLMRADNVALHSQGDMQPILMKSPSQLAEDDIKTAENQSIRGSILSQLHGGVPPTT